MENLLPLQSSYSSSHVKLFSFYSPLAWISRAVGLLCFLALWGAGPVSRALDGPTSFTIDLPFPGNVATPVWLGQPTVPERAFAALDLPIFPPDATSSLLITLFFTEKPGGFLRVSWQGQAGPPQMLSSNFYEGTGMSNQRSLLISAETLQGPGTIDLQCSENSLDIQRIRLEWLETKNGLVTPAIEDLLVTPANGKTESAQNFNGEIPSAAAAAWHGHVVTVPITDSPQRIEEGVEFSVQLDALPLSARLALKEEGLPWGQHVAVWLNEQRAGTLTPGVPDLADDGFLSGAVSSANYIGWRDGTIFVPGKFLKSGVNTIQFSTEDDVSGGDGVNSSAAAVPLAVKNVSLELVYPDIPVIAEPSTAASDITSSPTSPSSTP